MRDSRDIIPFICGHYLRVGFAHIAFIDDGSTDGTFEFLRSLSRRTRRISVRRVVSDRFEQRKLLNDAANWLIDEGYHIIVPFDADEFWNVNVKELEECCAAKEEIAFVGRWVNFIQTTNLTSPRPFGLFQIRHRATAISDANRETVTAFRRPFVFHSDTKTAFKASKRVELALGQHFLVGDVMTSERKFEIFHIPLRYRSELEKRGLNYEPRRALVRVNSGESWQSKFHRDIVNSNRIDEVWRANSARRAGYIEAYGHRFSIIQDTRLRRLLLNASAYLAFRFRVIAI